MSKQKIISELRKLTAHDYIGITTRGNTAITTALSILPKDKKLLIPEEGGWMHYRTAPKMLGIAIEEVKCADARIDLADLKKKLETKKCTALLYQNPGGYFAEQPMQEIYNLCKKYGCLVILDVSGGIGTKLCNGKFADIIIGSFGKWKLVEARVGGFISSKSSKVWDKIKDYLVKNKNYVLNDEEKLLKISQKLAELPERIRFLEDVRDRVINDLTKHNLEIVRPKDLGFVVVVKFKTDQEKEKIIKYCQTNQLEWTECPRYIRLMKKAISIEIKRL